MSLPGPFTTDAALQADVDFRRTAEVCADVVMRTFKFFTAQF